MFIRAYLPRVVGLLMLTLGSFGAPAVAQESDMMVGVVAGQARSTQIWKPSSEVRDVDGLVLGVFAEGGPRPGWFSLAVEAAYVRRGGDVMGTNGQVDGAIRSDYLSLSVRVAGSAHVGPTRVRLALGPALDYLARSRMTPGLQQVLEEPSGPVFGAMAGLGLGIPIGDGREVAVEARVYEGLNDAYSGDFVSVRHRAWEVVARVGLLRR